MNRRLFMLVGFLVWIAASLGVAHGQASAQNAPGAAPADSGQASAQSPGTQAPAKKVWTNEDVNGLRDQSVISTFSAPGTKSSKPGQKPASKGRDAKWYQEQIGKLQAKIPPLNDQIAALQAAINGKPTGSGKDSERPRGVKADSWPVERDQLEKKRGDIQNQIDALYEEARHNGIPDSALPPQL